VRLRWLAPLTTELSLPLWMVFAEKALVTRRFSLTYPQAVSVVVCRAIHAERAWRLGLSPGPPGTGWGHWGVRYSRMEAVRLPERATRSTYGHATEL
jgi:hypothetical protein